MNNDLLFQFETIIDDEGNIEIPKEKFMQLRNNGIQKILISVKKCTNKSESLNINSNISAGIKKMQALPGEVVDKFMSSKGKLVNFSLRNDF